MSNVGHEVFETNSIIRASAGTGKTFALATRFIRLMLIDGVKPETIVALTFSRAAAQEIYTKILDRLCAAAREGLDKNGKTFAENEWDTLLEDYRRGAIVDGARKLAVILKNPPPHGKDDFARLLRNLVDTQHLGAIATLDSFILKIVRNFPKEMGVQNAISVLDPADEDGAVEDAVRQALSQTGGAAQEVAEAFAVAQDGACPRQCLGAIGAILAQQGWRNFVLSHPECLDAEHGGARRWTVASMAAQLGVDVESVCPDLSSLPAGDPLVEKLVAHIRAYDGADSFLPKNKVSEAIDFFWCNPDACAYSHDYNRRHYDYPCGQSGARALHAGIRHMMNLYLTRQLEIVAAKIKLVAVVEKAYERMTRRMGKLTFADFTKYSAEEEFSRRGIAFKNVEYRFDATLDHWALDEFQDTSELQWRCLKELVRNAAEEGHEGSGRTAMAVGDMKQSIYTWRGASARPFEDIASWKAFEGFERDFSASHRYGPNIADFVNKVFGLGNIAVGEKIPAVCADAVEAWRRGWRDHVSHEAADYVKVVAAAKKEDDDEKIDELLPALYDEVSALWERHCAAQSVDTVGILVRSNADGLKVVEYLRKRGMRTVVWEGVNPCGDDTIVQAVLALLKLSEHPSDTAAWKTVSELLDIRSVLLANGESMSCAAVSAGVARALAQQGLSRTLKEWCEKLRASGRIRPDGRTMEKLQQLAGLAVAFESRTSGDGSMLAFADFVARSGKREIAASPDVIRVLTIHRSKGLGIDHVFVPLFESGRAKSAMDLPKSSMPLFDGGAWVLSHLAKGSEQYNAKTRAAYEKMRNDHFAESLRTYYVALTRAKKSMVVLLPAEKESAAKQEGDGLLMRDLIRTAVGDALPYVAGAMPSLEPKRDAADAQAAHTAWPVGEKRMPVRRVVPSQGAGKSAGGRNAADLFDVDFGDAAQKGVAAHATYAAIEWIDPAMPRNERERWILGNGFRAAFVRPSPDAVVWRERRYELFQSATWETGQFDRVVFSGVGANRTATIYDFKTNALEPGESEALFEDRMRRLHAPQMAAYRQALGRLTGLSPDRIAVRLLLEKTGRSLTL